MRFTFLLFPTLLLLTSCVVNKGSYTTTGSYEKIELSLTGRSIGILEARGVYGGDEALLQYRKELDRLEKNCVDLAVLDELNLRDQATLPALYGDSLSQEQLEFFASSYPKINYLVHLSVAPGTGGFGAAQAQFLSADQEASTWLKVYDLPGRELLKIIEVSGRLNWRNNLRWYEREFTEEEMGWWSMRLALRALERYSDCR